MLFIAPPVFKNRRMPAKACALTLRDKMTGLLGDTCYRRLLGPLNVRHFLAREHCGLAFVIMVDCKLFNDAVWSAEIIYCRKIWKDDDIRCASDVWKNAVFTCFKTYPGIRLELLSETTEEARIIFVLPRYEPSTPEYKSEALPFEPACSLWWWWRTKL
jgi:hypothetical protein